MINSNTSVCFLCPSAVCQIWCGSDHPEIVLEVMKLWRVTTAYRIDPETLFSVYPMLSGVDAKIEPTYQNDAAVFEVLRLMAW